MKRKEWLILSGAALVLLFSGCQRAAFRPWEDTASRYGSAPAGEDTASQYESAPAAEGDTASQYESAPEEGEAALSLALENAGVLAEDAYNVRTERGTESGIPIFQVEFETDWGDYSFEIAAASGRIIGADYEVDEEWLGRLGGSPAGIEEAKRIVQEKVPGADASEIVLFEEDEDGRGRYEGRLFHDGIQYEFEIDPATGRIFDWNADLRG